MIQITVENNRGEKLQLTNNPNYIVTRVGGLNPPNANIITEVTATFDGSTFKSSRVTDRNIVIEIVLADNSDSIEDVRLDLYRYFKVKKNVTLYLTTHQRDVYTTGYVEAFECNHFENRQKAQISLKCPCPYFINISSSVDRFSVITDLFKFPFSISSTGISFSEIVINSRKSIVNNGDVDCGLRIELHATGTVLNPKIYNDITGEFFILNIEMQAGDDIVISTNKGEKGVTHTHNGITTNIINKRQVGSCWFQIEPGENMFICSADKYPENLSCTFIHSDLYGGV